MECITYKGGYKYQLRQDYKLSIDLKPENPVITDFIELAVGGELTIKKGYAWDGPSGPTFDTSNFMRGSLVHDALYQLMRQEHLSHESCRRQADKLLQRICKEDGMSYIRAWWVYLGVRVGGDPAADPANEKAPVMAPRNARGLGSPARQDPPPRQ